LTEELIVAIYIYSGLKTQKVSKPSPVSRPSGAFPVLSQPLHVYECEENQLDHMFTRREDLERCGTFGAENAPVFAVERGDWRL
jgi:hypothetical protein